MNRVRQQQSATSAAICALGRFHSSASRPFKTRQRISTAKQIESLEARLLLSATTTTIDASAPTLVYGTTEIFTATIIDTSLGLPVTAGGTVTFYNGASVLGTMAVDINGQATLSTSTLSAGTYQVSAIYSGFLVQESSTSSVSNVTVTPATPTINVTAYDSTYSASPYTATGSVTGVNGVDLSSLLSLSGTTHTNAGTYIDTWSFHDPSGNYSDQSGTISNVIQQANATFFVTPYSVTYDGNSHSATGFAFGVVNENLSNLLSFTPQTDAGNYNNTWTFAGNSNYLPSSGTVNDIITPATLNVTANSQSKVYGATDPSMTYTASGFKSTDTDSSVLTGSLDRTTGEDVGIYAISQGTLVANSNYTINYTSNSLTITKATLNASADAQTKVYGSADPTLTYNVTGFQFSDDASLLTGSLARTAGENVFTYAISQGSLAANGNYSISFTNNVLTITPAALTVTADAITKVYGSSDPTLTYLASGFQFADSSSTVFSGALARITGENVNTYAIDQGSLTANNNYTVTFTGDNLTITPATLTVTASSQSKVYGANDPTLSYATAGLQFADSAASVLTGELTRATGEDAGSYAIGQGTLDVSGNYSLNFVGNNLTITKATLSISADAVTKVYGDTDPTLTFITTGLQFADTADSVMTGALARAAGENVGNYAISQGSLAANSNYTFSFVGNSLAVTKATLTVTTDAQTKVYGSADPSLTYVTTGLQFSDTAGSVLTGLLTRTAGENVFTYGISEGTLAANGNYTINFTGNNLTITPAALTLTADAITKVYGASDPTLTYVASGFQFSDTSQNVFTGTLTRAAGQNVDTYAISQGSLTANGNYTLTFTGNNLTITPATLTIAANSQTKVYGQSDPTLSYITLGLQLSDNAASVLTGALARAAGESTGTYAIDQGTLAANSNYTINFNAANLTISKATLYVSVDAQTKVYGDADPTLTYATTGLQFSDTASSVLTGALTRAAGENVGSYVISLGTLAANSDYTLNFTGNSLAITKAVLTVTTDAQTKVYGTVDPTLTYVTTGLQFSDTTSVLTGHLTRAAGENVFTYAINEGTLATNGNYTLNFVGNNLAITPAALTVTANAQTKVYGASDPTLTFVATGLQFADTSASALSGAMTRATGENVNTYAISQGSLAANGNYTLTFTGDNLTITPATLTVTANSQTKVYGQADPTLSYATTGLQLSDNAASVLTGALARAAGESAGTYAIDQGTLAANSNYTINFNAANLTISKAMLYVSVDAQTKVYGDADPTLTFATTGLQFTDTASSVLTGALTRAAGENVGNYAISVGTLAANSDYTISFTGNTLAITKAVLTVTTDAQTKVYGAVDPTLTYVTTGLQFSDTASGVLTGQLARAAGENVFTYAIAEGTLAANGNYSLNFVGNNLTITPAALTVTANTQTKVYGASDPTLTYVATGFQFADSSLNALTGTLTRAAGENVNTYAISQGSLAANSNYTLTFTGDNLTITPAILTVTANSQSKVYGQSDPTLSYTTTGLQFSENVSTVLTGALARAIGEDAGTYAIDQGTLAASSNYTISFNGANLTISKATLYISVDAQTKVYGDADPTLTYVTTGLQFSDTAASVLTGSLTRAAGENVGNYAISMGTLAANSNYTTSFTGNTLAITKAVLTVTTDAQTKVYGSVDPTLTYVTTGLQFSDTTSSVLTGQLTRAAGENVFTYAITGGTLASNGNYTLNFVGNNLTITPAALTVTANAQSKVYGANDPTLSFVATGYQFADSSLNALTGTLTRAAGENVNTYAIGQGSLAANGNYTLTFVGDNLTITPATLTVTVNSQTKVYGQADPTLTYVTTGLQFSENAASVLTGAVARATGEDVGTYAISQDTLAANANYTLNFVGNNLTITKATLYISADALTKVYGDADPTLSFVATGLQLSDTVGSVLTGALTRAAGENVGNYAITMGTLAANGNYTTSFTGNTLAITKAVLTVTTDAQTKVYGSVDPTLTYVTTGLQFTDTASGVLTGSLTRAAGENVFTYAISAGTLASNGNYSLNFIGNNLTITPAALTITTNAQTKVYGANDPTLTYVASGYQFADTGLNVLSGALARAAGENVNTYAINQGTLAANGNYTLTFTGDNLTITPATLTVTVNPQTKVYGQTDPTLTYVTTGLQFSENAASVLTGAVARAAGEGVGTYAISQDTLAANANYTLNFVGNNLTITKATLSISADALTKVYGDADPTLSFLTTGLQFSDTASSVLTGALTRAAGENVGNYAISLGTLAANSDYTISFTGSSLAITKAMLTVTADAQTKVYGTVDPALTYVTTGLQFSDTAGSVLTGHLTRAAGENVFTYPITEGTLATNGNYSLNFVGNDLTITPATLTVTANAQTKVYGANDPTLTYVSSGFQFNDNAAGVLSGALARATGESVGSYAINQGALVSNNNYTISFTGDNLTITAAVLTVTANSQTKIYGAADPTLTYVATGFQFSDDATSVLSGLLSRAAGESVGSYAINQGSLAANGDYTINFVGNTLTITNATLTVIVDAQTKVYGSADPTLTYVVTGLQFSDDVNDVFTGSLTRTAGENVGTYLISQGSLTTIGDYSFTFISNSLTITAATLDITANAQSKILNTADPTLTYTVAGLQFTDNAASVLSGVLARDAGEDVGDYAINQGSLAANNNYIINFNTDNLTIWDPAQRVVFQTVPATGIAGTKLAPSLKVAVLDSNGNVVTTDRSVITIEVTSGPGNFAAGSTLTATAVNGIATFNNLILNTSGTYTLTVSDGTLTTATSSSITINAAAASQLVLQQTPTTGTAGVALSPGVVVYVQDKFGNMVQNAAVVTLVMNGSFSTNQTTVSAASVAGVATFNNLIINKAGSYSLFATVGSISSSNFSITVNAATGTKLAFAQPPTASMAAGGVINPAIVVVVQDQFGNTVTSDSSTVNLTLSTGTFSNNSATASVTAQNGIATFSSLIINKIGTYKLTASNSASLTTVSSQNFTVVPGVISSLSIVQKPTTGTAGTAVGAVKISALDQFGNAITTASSITLTLSSGTFSNKLAAVSATTSAGTATFSNLIFGTAGTYTLSASANGVQGPSFSVTISPAAASKLVFQQVPPASGTAGVALSPSVVVAIQDNFGNLITTDNSTVTLTLAGGTFSSGAATVTAQAVNGVATFSSLTINKAGTSYTLSASDGALAKATSAKIAISSASGSQLTIQSVPAKGIAGVALSPAIKVAVLDPFGNIVTSDNSSVTLTLSSGTFGNGSSTMTVAAVNGIALFGSVIINKTGTYKLTASSGSMTTATSPNIVITSNTINRLVVSQNPTAGTAGAALGTAVQVQVLDLYGNLVTTSSTVKLMLSSGTFSTRVNSVSVTTTTGIATFSSLIFNTAGAYTLTASVNTITASSFNVTVSPASASKLVFTQAPPTTVSAGVTLSPAVVVSVQDQFGNVVTTDSSTVTLTLSAGTFSTGLTKASVTAVNGIATFNNLTINKSGSYKLTASDSAPLTTAVSSNIVVTAAAATRLAIQQSPTTGIAGTNLGPAIKVAILDAFGNIVTTNTSTVTLTLSSGTFSNGSTTASVSASLGVATFSSLNITVTGSYTLTASSSPLTTTSFNVTVNPAAARKLVFVQAPPTSGSIGVALSPSVVVAIQDQYGNLVVSDTSMVTLTLAGGTFSNNSTTVTVRAVGGVATFSGLTIGKAGSAYTLTASDGSLTKVTSLAIAIS